jgi:hypothetical protein
MFSLALVAAVWGTGPAAPEFQLSASGECGKNYAVQMAADGLSNTHWAAPNRPPVWIQARFPEPRTLSRIRVRQCSQTAIYDNWRRVSVSFSDGSGFSCLLGDRWQEQVMEFSSRKVRWVRITVESTYKTSHYVGLAEIAFDDQPVTSQPGVDVSINPRPEARRLAPDSPVTSEEDARQRQVLERLSSKRFGRADHPTLFANADDVERAKANVRRHRWAHEVFTRVLASADAWLARSDDQLRRLIPDKGALFDNKAACPRCGTQCSVDLGRPGTVSCGVCKRSYPDADHPDDGRGWTDPKTGTVTYFVGLYNSAAVDRVTDAALDLADAYAVTGDERYARVLSVLLDGLAAIYPSCDKGPVWYPGVGGRLNRPFYQTARTLIWYASAYDLTYRSPEWDRPSLDPAFGSRRANYEQNLLRNGAEYCFQQVLKQPSPGLHNGNCDYLQGALAVGRVLGIPRYIGYVLESDLSIFNFVENTIDRDGQYYETSFGYSRHAVELFSHHAEMLRNYRSPKHPQGVNLYDHPKLRMNFQRAEGDVDCAGHQPALGDAGPDLLVIRSDNRDALRWRVYDRLEILLARTSDIRLKGELRQRLWELAEGDVEQCRARSPNARWLLFHADGLPRPAQPQATSAGTQSTLLAGARGVAVLRSAADDRQCALLRYGPTLNHGSADEMNVNLYALGREISYDQGYGWAHHRGGWAHTTVAHNVVVVNEKNQLLGAQGAGGSLEHFAQSPRVRLVAADDPLAYASEGVTRYRRLLAMVDAGGGSYLLDVFDVRGGTRHDFSQHFAGRLEQTEGVTFGPPQTAGSVAGPEYEWWKRIQASGWIAGLKKPFYWIAPPENGYGFLFAARSSTGASPAPRFVWKLGDREVTDPGAMVGPAQCPTAADCPYVRLASGACSVDAPGAGAGLAVRMTVEQAGEYLVLARFLRSPASGRVAVSVDGQPLNRVCDTFSPVSYPGQSVCLGRARLGAGTHELRFASAGKDPESTGYHFTLERLGLVRPTALDAMGQEQAEAVALTVLPPPDSRLVRAKAKGLAQAPESDYLLMRRSGQNLASRFVSVIEPFFGQGPTRTATALAPADGGQASLSAVKVAGTDGRTDFLFDFPDGPTPASFRDGPMAIRFEGRFAAVLTRSGTPTEILLCGARRLGFGTLDIVADQVEHLGRVTAVDYAKRRVAIDVPLARAAGQLGWFTRDAYSRNAPFRIADNVSVPGGGSELDLGGTSLVLGRGRATSDVSAEGLVSNGVPLDRERAFGRKIRTRYFDGKAIRNLRTGQLGRIKNANLDGSLVLDVNPGLRRGDAFELFDVQAGDRLTIPAVIALWPSAPGEWILRSNVPATLTLPGAKSLSVQRSDGQFQLLPRAAPGVDRWRYRL